MANVQPDKYTKVANELLEQVPKFKFNGTQLRIILVIWRYTFGFRRKDHKFSLTFLAEATNTHKNQIARELKTLIEKRVLKVVSDETFTESRTLRFIKDYSTWLIVRESSKKVTVSELGDSQSAKKVTPPVSGLGDQERKRSLKKIFKEIYSPEEENIILSQLKERINTIYSHWNNCDLIKHRSLSPQIELQIKWALANYSPEELQQSISTYSDILNNPDYKLTTRWGIDDFLGKSHFEKFLPDRDPYSFYPKVAEFNKPPKKSNFQKNKELLMRGRGAAHDIRSSGVPAIQSGGELPER